MQPDGGAVGSGLGVGAGGCFGVRGHHGRIWGPLKRLEGAFEGGYPNARAFQVLFTIRGGRT